MNLSSDIMSEYIREGFGEGRGRSKAAGERGRRLLCGQAAGSRKIFFFVLGVSCSGRIMHF